MTGRRILVASNRGPVSFTEKDGEFVPVRGSGGLVTGLVPAIEETGGLWIAAAMTDGDRLKAREAGGGAMEVKVDDSVHHVRMLEIDADVYHRFYNNVSNSLLWFLHHYLWDLPREPALGEGARQDWDAYRSVNVEFAGAIAEESEGSDTDILIQDYHLSLVPSALREMAPKVRSAYFHHVPFAGADYLRLLPQQMREQLLAGLLGADLVGFHTERWAENFLSACRLLEDASVMYRRRAVRWHGRLVRVGVYPIAIDAPALREAAGEPGVRVKRKSLELWRGDRKLLLRVDRSELSKNILRGFTAYERFLRHNPEWRNKIVFLALLNPSRLDVEEYRIYTEECVAEANRINEAFGDADWTPIELRMNRDFEEVLAAYQTYDVLMVNPVFDGMNLVAKEGTLLNRKHGTLILSRTAGAYAELGKAAIGVDPVDIAGMADAILEGLTMPQELRTQRATALRRASGSRTPAQWVRRQLRDLERAGHS